MRRELVGETEHAPNANTSAHRQRMVGITKRRGSPRFLICDSSMRVLYASPGVEEVAQSSKALRSLEPRCRESRTTNTVLFEAYDDETVLRIVPLDTQLFGCVAIFVDVFGHRGSVFEAAKKYGLTKRESQVLALMVRATTQADIAAQLCVAESTVGDHIKSIMRKMDTSKRIEIISKVFKLEHDLTTEQSLS